MHRIARVVLESNEGKMKTKFLPLLFLCAAGLPGQTVETIPFRAVLSPANEVPAIDINASGTATVWMHVVRDASGNIVSGSCDFNVNYSFPGDVTFTGLHIHAGPAGQNAAVTVSSGLSGTNSVNDPTGKGSFSRQGQVAATDTIGLATLKGMLQDPSQYYVNMHTTVNPGGVIRGQLQRARAVVLMGLMSPANEVPAITGTDAKGVATVIALATDNSAQVIFDTNYSGFPDGTRFTGHHIHLGSAGLNGPVTINTGISGGTSAVPAAAGGSGNLHYEVEVPMSSAAAVQTLNNLFTNPSATYINLHTETNPGGMIRAPLRATDRLPFQVVMSPANEVPPITGLDASAPAQVVVHTVRNDAGDVVAGAVVFDVNYRFPGDTTFTGLHVHDGPAGQNGPVTISSGLSGTNTVATATGFGNIYRTVTVSTTGGLATLNSLIKNPENHYVNLHTTVNPGGVIRSQLAPAITANPSIDNVIAAVSDGTLKTLAPGSLMTIFGSNLTKVPADLTGWLGSSIPLAFNGTSVTVGGKAAAVVSMTRSYIVAQTPVDVAVGPAPVIVTTSNGASTAFNSTVAATAPAIFFDSLGAIAVRNADFSLIRPDNPARAGDILVVYATGLGTPSVTLATGQLAPSVAPFAMKSGVTATINGQTASVIYALASPGLTGVDQVAVRLPAGVAAGNASLVLLAGGVSSNSVTIPVR